MRMKMAWRTPLRIERWLMRMLRAHRLRVMLQGRQGGFSSAPAEKEDERGPLDVVSDVGGNVEETTEHVRIGQI